MKPMETIMLNIAVIVCALYLTFIAAGTLYIIWTTIVEELL
jgi:hypothetical protein